MSENAPKISVIVPMYNAEKYLSLCISSILAQTFTDFELILIDDCSTDKTFEIAKSFSDSRIKLLQNEKNLGMPGSVRNVGIDAARGEYIYFCDNDDVILGNALEILLKAAEENNADVVNTTSWYVAQNPDFTSVENIQVVIQAFPPAQRVSTNVKERIFQEFLQNRIHITPWIFLYRREFLLQKNIRFPDAAAEDAYFNFDVVCATSNITKIDVPFYIWRPNPNSTTKNPQRVQKNMQGILIFFDHIEEKLAPLNDENFTRIVLQYWTGHVINSYIVPFLQSGGGGQMASEREIFNALEPRFKENSSFMFTLLQLYSILRVRDVENRKLEFNFNQVIQENKILKDKLQKIEQIIKV